MALVYTSTMISNFSYSTSLVNGAVLMFKQPDGRYALYRTRACQSVHILDMLIICYGIDNF